MLSSQWSGFCVTAKRFSQNVHFPRNPECWCLGKVIVRSHVSLSALSCGESLFFLSWCKFEGRAKETSLFRTAFPRSQVLTWAAPPTSTVWCRWCWSSLKQFARGRDGLRSLEWSVREELLIPEWFYLGLFFCFSFLFHPICGPFYVNITKGKR